MLKIGLFCVLTPCAAMEMFYYHQFGIVLVGTLYFGLSMQADFSAQRLILQNLNLRRLEAEPEVIELKVVPLGEKRKNKPVPPRNPALLFPNFRGLPHEILAVPEDADTRTIVNAFRHWIKRFHPDKDKAHSAASANEKARQITEAKHILLERHRRSNSKNAA